MLKIMKVTTLAPALAIALISSMAHAETAAQICQKISNYSASNGTACLAIVSQADYFAPEATNICSGIADYSASNGIDCLKRIADKRFESAPTAICKKIANYSASNGMACLDEIAEKTYNPELLQTCSTQADYSASNGMACMRTIARPMPSHPSPNCPDGHEMRGTLNRVIQELDQYRNEQARADVVRLLRRLEPCY